MSAMPTAIVQPTMSAAPHQAAVVLASGIPIAAATATATVLPDQSASVALVRTETPVTRVEAMETAVRRMSAVAVVANIPTASPRIFSTKTTYALRLRTLLSAAVSSPLIAQ